MTKTLDTDFYAELMLETTSQEGEQQELDHSPSLYREGVQLTEDERKDHVAHVLALHIKYNRFQNQVWTIARIFSCTSDEFFSR